MERCLCVHHTTLKWNDPSWPGLDPKKMCNSDFFSSAKIVSQINFELDPVQRNCGSTFCLFECVLREAWMSSVHSSRPNNSEPQNPSIRFLHNIKFVNDALKLGKCSVGLLLFSPFFLFSALNGNRSTFVWEMSISELLREKSSREKYLDCSRGHFTFDVTTTTTWGEKRKNEFDLSGSVSNSNKAAEKQRSWITIKMNDGNRIISILSFSFKILLWQKERRSKLERRKKTHLNCNQQLIMNWPRLPDRIFIVFRASKSADWFIWTK